jgi:hypothetical protein
MPVPLSPAVWTHRTEQEGGQMSASLSEKLEWENGSLVATPSGWRLTFYKPGPDRRYKGRFWEFHEDKILRLIQNYKTAMDRLDEVRRILPRTSSYQERHGELTIRMGFGAGITIDHDFGHVGDRQKLDFVISRLEWSLCRGPELVALAKEIAATQGN